ARARGGNPLVEAVGKLGIEVRLERQRTRFHAPRAVLQLRAQQETNPPLIGRSVPATPALYNATRALPVPEGVLSSVSRSAHHHRALHPPQQSAQPADFCGCELRRFIANPDRE